MKLANIGALLMVLATAGNAFAGTATATINVTGRITASPCTVDTSTVSQTVDLGRVYGKDLAPGKGSEWKTFQLTLSKCPSNWKQATVTFTGNPAPDNNYYANSGSATGVVLQISDSGHSTSYGNGDTLTETIDASRNAVFPLEARMFNPGGTIGTGDFNAVLEVDFSYQ